MTPSQMARIHAACFPRGWSVGELDALLAKPTTIPVTSSHGFALLQIIAPEAELLTIAVPPADRRKGHGRTLLSQTLRTAAAAGAETLFLEVDANNQAACALYLAAGFVQTGTRRNYYAHDDGGRSDAILMSRALEPGT